MKLVCSFWSLTHDIFRVHLAISLRGIIVRLIPAVPAFHFCVSMFFVSMIQCLIFKNFFSWLFRACFSSFFIDLCKLYELRAIFILVFHKNTSFSLLILTRFSRVAVRSLVFLSLVCVHFHVSSKQIYITEKRSLILRINKFSNQRPDQQSRINETQKKTRKHLTNWRQTIESKI